MPYRSILDVLRTISSLIPVAKPEDVKPILDGLQSKTKLFVQGSCMSIYDAMVIFVRLERGYASLSFVNTKSVFFRRENYESSYRALQSGFEQIPIAAFSNDANEERRLAAVMGILCGIRSDLVSFYLSLDANPSKLLANAVTSSEEFEKMQQTLLTIGGDAVSDVLQPICAYMHDELAVLVCLLRAQKFISNLHFIDSLLCLQETKDRWSAYSGRFKSCIPQHSRSVPKLPALPLWLFHFYNTMLAKYTLYWFATLSQSTGNSSSVLDVSSREKPAFVHRIIEFHRRTNAAHIALFFDTTCQPYPFLGHGYVVRGTTGDAPTGVESIPIILKVPLDESIPTVDVYSIVMQISGKSESDDLTELVYSFDEKVDRTYFIMKLEYRVFMAVIYAGYRARKDRQIMDFIFSLSSAIRLQTLCTALRLH